MVIPSLTPEAGAERSLAAVIPFMVETGVEMHLAVLTTSQGLVPEVRAAGVRVHDLSGLTAAPRIRAIRSLIRSLEPDLLHATLLQASVPSRLAAFGTGVPLLVSWANTPTDRRADPVATWKLTTVWLAELATAHGGSVKFHAVTDGVAETKAAELHVSPARVRTAERGRSPQQFHPATPAERIQARADLGVGDGDTVVLAVGRQEPQKGYPDLVRAFDPVAEDRPGLRLFIAGRSGSGSAELLRVIDGARHAERITLLGQRDDVVPLLHAADFVVCASHREGAAGALIEAMACGAPILSVELDGMRGVLVDGLNSLVVPRERLGGGIEQMAADPGAAGERAAAALELFHTRFTVERSAAALLEVYRWAAE